MPPVWLVAGMDHEAVIFWRTLGITLMAMGFCELLSPAHRLRGYLEKRWGIHGLLFVLCTALALSTLPISRVALARTVANGRFGLLNLAVIPFWIQCIAGILVLDLGRYGLHWLMHANRWFWRLHLLHHSDPDVDISTGLRFHPLEELAAMFIGSATIVALGVAPSAVFLFEVMVAFQAGAAHANVRVPAWLERFCRPFFFTPTLHRIHHSIKPEDQGTNLGVLFPFWDRLFGTYREMAEPEAQAMTFGLAEFPKEKILNVPYLLAVPFVTLPSSEEAVPDAAISRRA